jgi:hypothetical protein
MAFSSRSVTGVAPSHAAQDCGASNQAATPGSPGAAERRPRLDVFGAGIEGRSADLEGRV